MQMPDLEVEAKQRLREVEVEANLCNASKDVMLSQDILEHLEKFGKMPHRTPETLQATRTCCWTDMKMSMALMHLNSNLYE